MYRRKRKFPAVLVQVGFSLKVKWPHTQSHSKEKYSFPRTESSWTQKSH